MAYTVAPFYNVGSSVGRVGMNRPEDVMLVQYFFSSFSIDSFGWGIPLLNGPDFMPAGGFAPIYPINGLYTPPLTDWILSFQITANQKGLGPLVTDGVVSHVESAWGNNQRSVSHRWYTIYLFNKLLFLADKVRFLNLATDSTVPPLLQNALKFVVCSSLSG